MPRPLRVINLTSSLIRYAEGLCLQNQLAEQRRNGVIGDTLVLLQVVLCWGFLVLEA